MVDKNPSLYKLVLTAAERANQIREGSPTCLDTQSKKHTTIALQEIAEGLVWYEADEIATVKTKVKAAAKAAAKAKAEPKTKAKAKK